MKIITNERVEKNIRFGVARGLTHAAKVGQAASLKALPKQFTLRGQWFQPSNRFGIKINPARRDGEPVASVYTRADWLDIQEEGGTKRGAGRIAIPVEARRSPTAVLRRSERPANVPKKFEIKTKRQGTLLVKRVKKANATRRRENPFSGLKVLYRLKPDVKVRKRSAFYAPVTAAIKRQVQGIIARSIREALSS
jgi:hypothetical protein